MPWTDYGWEDDPSTATPLDAEKLEDFGEHVHDAAAATAATAAGTALTAHTTDTSAAHAASAISFSPTGTIASTDAQAAIAEVASERVSADNALDARVTTLEGAGGGSGLPATIEVRTASYTATAGDFALMDATSGDLVVTLPTTPATGALVTVKKADSSANTVNVDAPGGLNIDGNSSGITLLAQNEVVIVEHIGAGSWKIVSLSRSAQSGSTADINTQTGDYTLTLSDAGKVVEVNSASAQVVTVPPDASVAFPVGTLIEVRQYGAGSVTIAPGAAVTVNSPDGLLAVGRRYSSVSLHKRATDEWILTGDLA